MEMHHYSYTESYEIYKGYIGTDSPVIPMMFPMQSSNGNQLQNHLIGTDTGVKLGTVPICIGMGITIGITVG